MSKTIFLTPQYVELMPRNLDEGIIYISNKYRTSAHLCCCGCRCKVVTPLKPGAWTLTVNEGNVSLSPSVGNWGFPCQSHYWIRQGVVTWASKWSPEQVAAGRTSDRLARESHFKEHVTIWTRLLKWIRKIFKL